MGMLAKMRLEDQELMSKNKKGNTNPDVEKPVIQPGAYRPRDNRRGRGGGNHEGHEGGGRGGRGRGGGRGGVNFNQHPPPMISYRGRGRGRGRGGHNPGNQRNEEFIKKDPVSNENPENPMLSAIYSQDETENKEEKVEKEEDPNPEENQETENSS